MAHRAREGDYEVTTNRASVSLSWPGFVPAIHVLLARTQQGERHGCPAFAGHDEQFVFAGLLAFARKIEQRMSGGRRGAGRGAERRLGEEPHEH